MDYLRLSERNIVIMGVANRRSVAWATAEVLRESGAHLIYLFKDQELLEKNRKLIGESAPALVCDVESQSDMETLPTRLRNWCRCAWAVTFIALPISAMG